MHLLSSQDDLSRRVASIETKLDNLQEMLSSLVVTGIRFSLVLTIFRYLPALLNQTRDNGNPNIHSTSPHQSDLNGRESFDLLSMTSATAIPPHNATA